MDIKKYKESYKQTLKNDKLKVKKLSLKLKNAKTSNMRIKLKNELNDLKMNLYKKRKEKYGFYEELNWLKNKNVGKRNLTNEQIQEWNKFKKSLLGKAERVYDKFLKEDKNLDFSRVSYFVKNKYGREKFSVKYMLNMTKNMIPTNTREFEDMKKMGNRLMKRLKSVKPKNKSGYYSNSSFHIGDVYMDDEASEGYVEKKGEYDDFNNFVEYESGKEPKYNVEEMNDREDEFYKGVSEDELEDAYTEMYSDDEYRDDEMRKLYNITYQGPFKIFFNVSNQDLIENIEVWKGKEVTMNDYEKLERYIQRYNFPNRVAMGKLRGSIKRRETWRRKRLEKEKEKH